MGLPVNARYTEELSRTHGSFQSNAREGEDECKTTSWAGSALYGRQVRQVRQVRREVGRSVGQ